MNPPVKTGKKRDYANWKVFSIRLRDAEAEQFDEVCAGLNVKRNAALRKVIRKIAGFLEPELGTVQDVRNLSRQLGGIATNINQIAKVANRTGQIDVIGLHEERVALGQQLAKTDALMQQFLNIGARKKDGLKRLEKVLEDE